MISALFRTAYHGLRIWHSETSANAPEVVRLVDSLESNQKQLVSHFVLINWPKNSLLSFRSINIKTIGKNTMNCLDFKFDKRLTWKPQIEHTRITWNTSSRTNEFIIHSQSTYGLPHLEQCSSRPIQMNLTNHSHPSQCNRHSVVREEGVQS